MLEADTSPRGASWFEAPPVELLRALAVLGEPPHGEHALAAHALGLGEEPDPSHYADVFLFQLYPYASVYLGAEGMLGGEARDRAAGFWRAVGRTPPAEPDHVSALLGLGASLLEEAGPDADGDTAESALARQAFTALLHEHLATWVFPFLDRIVALAPGFYAAWAELLARAVEEAMVETGPPKVAPAALREVPPLADPRSGERDGFVAALLAPARTGVIVTRADLAGVAADVGLGVRAGERRYALEHILGLEPEGVLDALARSADVAAAGHARRAHLLGPVSEHWEERARGTAELLRSLAAEDLEPVTEASTP